MNSRTKRKRIVGGDHPQALPPSLPKTVGHLWEITQFLGQGSFGAIYKGVKLKGAPTSVGNRPVPEVVAIKFESIRTPYPQLASEKQVIQMIHDASHPEASNKIQGNNRITSNGTDVTKGGILGFPHYFYYGIEGEFYCLAMTLLGPSLYSLFEDRVAPKWTFNTVAPLGIQMLDRIEVFHKKGYIHRDIKPDNFLIGPPGRHHLVTMIDFGLAKTYRTSSGAHQPAEDGKQLTGTARYASITAHKGMEQSRRDDLEALMYCLLFFLLGKLPWQGLKPQADQEQKYSHILKVKELTPIDDICRPTGSTEIFRCLKEVRSYAYNQRPRYGWLRNHLLTGMISRMPIYRCVRTNTDGSVTVQMSKLNEELPSTVRVAIPDWHKSEEWCNAAITLEERFAGTHQYRQPKVLGHGTLPNVMGYPGEAFDLDGGDALCEDQTDGFLTVTSRQAKPSLTNHNHVRHRGSSHYHDPKKAAIPHQTLTARDAVQSQLRTSSPRLSNHRVVNPTLAEPKSNEGRRMSPGEALPFVTNSKTAFQTSRRSPTTGILTNQVVAIENAPLTSATRGRVYRPIPNQSKVIVDPKHVPVSKEQVYYSRHSIHEPIALQQARTAHHSQPAPSREPVRPVRSDTIACTSATAIPIHAIPQGEAKGYQQTFHGSTPIYRSGQPITSDYRGRVHDRGDRRS